MHTGPDERPAEHHSVVEDRLAEKDALRRAAEAWGEVMVERRRRVEVDAKRISDEVSRQARERQILAAEESPGPAPDEHGWPSLESPSREPVERPQRRLPAPLNIQRLLVPLDGTTYSERALPYAAALAAATGASVTLAHVRTPTPSRAAGHLDSLIRGFIADRPDVTITDFPTYLHWTREWMLQYVPNVSIQQIDALAPLKGLLDLERQTNSDLVIIASHARQGPERMMLGSVADGLVRDGSLPVLVIPPLAEPPTKSMPLIARVLVPLDGSELAETALGPVLGWLGGEAPSEFAPHELMLLTVVESQAAMLHGERYVRSIRDLLAPSLRAVEVHAHVRLGSAPGTIVSVTSEGLLGITGEQVRPDLIIMATHGRGGLGRWLYGSVASYVLQRVAVPVLLTHPSHIAG
ncbi:MAG TPA: universal stress protein [Ktedonobacterales bacterium]